MAASGVGDAGDVVDRRAPRRRRRCRLRPIGCMVLPSCAATGLTSESRRAALMALGCACLRRGPGAAPFQAARSIVGSSCFGPRGHPKAPLHVAGDCTCWRQIVVQALVRLMQCIGANCSECVELPHEPPATSSPSRSSPPSPRRERGRRARALCIGRPDAPGDGVMDPELLAPAIVEPPQARGAVASPSWGAASRVVGRAVHGAAQEKKQSMCLGRPGALAGELQALRPTDDVACEPRPTHPRV